ncbi:MAG: type IV secretion system DNA-binding domain-containing protein [Patescibacteria group bacterium]|nr:type IV secretion system DNA-binding domain-containing protein [Patescibacteria group bacterium]
MNLFGLNLSVFFKSDVGLILLASMVIILIAGVTLGLLFIVRFFVRRAVLNKSYFDHQIFLIRLPKEKPQDENKEASLQQMREEISRGETIFSSIGGLKAQTGLKSWFLGRNDHFAFEIVASKSKIAFYAAAPRSLARYLEQQITAHYPAAVIEEIEDYNIFGMHGQIAAANLKTRKSFVLPLRTYQKIEVDPLNSLINIMSKLDKDESISIQYVVRSAKSAWHRQVRSVVRRIQKKNSVADGISSNLIGQAFSVFGDLFKIKSEADKAKPLNTDTHRLSAVEEETLKSIEEKNLRAGLDVNLRIIVSSISKERSNAYLENVVSVFTEYNNYSYGNVFSRAIKGNQPAQIRDFIYRRFREDGSFLLNTEELTSIFHLPLSHMETPNILWLTAKNASAPADIPSEGLLLGENVYRGVKQDIRIKRQDRRRHTYVVGKSGVGKSVLLANMAIQDIQNGEGVCVLDPHGDLIEDILQRIPPERAEDVVIFSPADLERPLALNLLEYDPRYPEQKSFVINEMIGIFDKLYDLKTTGGPMFEQYMRNALLLIMEDPESGSTLMEIPKVLSDENFRKMKLSRCHNRTVVDFWKKEAEKAGGDAALANIVPYITSKLTSFISNDMMRPIIGQQKSSFNFRDLMDRQKILLIDLPKGVVGEMNAYLLGMIVVGKILMAALSRADMPSEGRKDFYLYIDEFQNFTTNSVCQILSEARKYALNLIIAHQYIGQLSKNNNTEIKDAVFGNVGTMISFKIGTEDAEFLVKEFAPVFNAYDMINIDKGTAYIKLLVDNSPTRPFSMKTIWPLLGTQREGISKKIRALSRLKYGQDRSIVEAEIIRRTETRTPVMSIAD